MLNLNLGKVSPPGHPCVSFAFTMSRRYLFDAPFLISPPPSSPLPSGVDPALIQRLLPLLSQMNRAESSETTAFLLALRPFLKPERRDKVERAAQLARLIHLAKLFLLSQEG